MALEAELLGLPHGRDKGERGRGARGDATVFPCQTLTSSVQPSGPASAHPGQPSGLTSSQSLCRVACPATRATHGSVRGPSHQAKRVV